MLSSLSFIFCFPRSGNSKRGGGAGRGGGSGGGTKRKCGGCGQQGMCPHIQMVFIPDHFIKVQVIKW